MVHDPFWWLDKKITLTTALHIKLVSNTTELKDSNANQLQQLLYTSHLYHKEDILSLLQNITHDAKWAPKHDILKEWTLTSRYTWLYMPTMDECDLSFTNTKSAFMLWQNICMIREGKLNIIAGVIIISSAN